MKHFEPSCEKSKQVLLQNESTGKPVLLQIDKSIATVTINAPPVNALSGQVVLALGKVFAELSDRDIKVIVLTGQGYTSFSAGANIKEFAARDVTGNRLFFAELYRVLDLVENIKFPVIAAVNGFALGAGLELALCADIRVMDERAQLAVSGANIGLVFSSQRLPRLIGRGRSKELAFTARKVGAAEAEKIGIAEYVAPAGTALVKARAIAQIITEKAPIAVQKAKQAINAGFKMTIDEGLALEHEFLDELLQSEEFQRRVEAFILRE